INVGSQKSALFDNFPDLLQFSAIVGLAAKRGDRLVGVIAAGSERHQKMPGIIDARFANVISLGLEIRSGRTIFGRTGLNLAPCGNAAGKKNGKSEPAPFKHGLDRDPHVGLDGATSSTWSGLSLSPGHHLHYLRLRLSQCRLQVPRRRLPVWESFPGPP